MSFQVLAEQQQLQQTTPLFNAELINKYSKYVKTIGKRVVEGFMINFLILNKIFIDFFSFFFSGILLVSSKSKSKFSITNDGKTIYRSTKIYLFKK
jgi:hypothetical protein